MRLIDHVNTTLSKLRQPTVTALSTDPDSEAYKAAVAVRRAVGRIWAVKQWTFKQRQRTFATTSGTHIYRLPKDVGELYQVLVSTSPYVIPERTENYWNDVAQQPTYPSGNPEYYSIFRNVPSLQDSFSSTLSYVSSNAADTTQTVLVVGMTDANTFASEEITLTGTTTVTGSISFSVIHSITKSGTTAGTVTITNGANTVAILSPNENISEYKVMKIYKVPSSAYTVTLLYYADAPRLNFANESALIPSRWDYVVDQWSFAFALQAKGQEQVSEQQVQFQLATSFLNDMSAQEKQTSNLKITSEKWNHSEWRNVDILGVPEGYGIVEDSGY